MTGASGADRPDRDPPLLEIALALADGVFAVVEDGRGQGRAGVPFRETVVDVLRIADAAGGDDGYRYPIGDGPGEGQVVAVLGAVAVHAGEQDLAGAVLDHALGPAQASMPVGLRPPWVNTSQ